MCFFLKDFKAKKKKITQSGNCMNGCKPGIQSVKLQDQLNFELVLN